MTAHNEKAGFYIGVTCPGCGGSLEIQADFFVLTCTSCGSVLRIRMPETTPAYLIECAKSEREAKSFADRYLKKASLPLTESGAKIRGIYQPYWKVDAILLKVRNRIEERHVSVYESGAEQDIKTENRVTDTNLSAYSMTHSAGEENEEIPHSIGMRANYIRMEPYSQEIAADNFEFLPVVRPWNKVISNIEQGTARLNEINPAAFGKNRTRLFRPMASIVYFPYYIIESESQGKLRRLIVDGVSGGIASYSAKCQYWENECKNKAVIMEFGRLEVELHRCPNCGHDLPGKQSYAYICNNCNQLIMLETNPLLQENILVSAGNINDQDRLFPFWSMKLPEKEIGSVKSMFGGIYNSDRLIIPAFRSANFESMFKLSKRISSAAPKMDFAPIDEIDDRFEPVSLGLNEALVMAEVIVCRAKTGKTDGEIVESMGFSPAEIALIFTPFHPESYFFVDSVLGAVTFEKNAVI